MSSGEQSQSLDDKQDLKRMGFLLPMQVYEQFVAYVPWGLKGHFLTKLVEIAVERIGRGGEDVVGMVLSGEYNPLFEEDKEK